PGLLLGLGAPVEVEPLRPRLVRGNRVYGVTERRAAAVLDLGTGAVQHILDTRFRRSPAWREAARKKARRRARGPAALLRRGEEGRGRRVRESRYTARPGRERGGRAGPIRRSGPPPFCRRRRGRSGQSFRGCSRLGLRAPGERRPPRDSRGSRAPGG